MQILLAGLLLSIWGLMIYSAPKRKRFGPRRPTAGATSVDGEENESSDDFSDCGGDFGGDCGGGDGGGDGGGGD